MYVDRLRGGGVLCALLFLAAAIAGPIVINAQGPPPAPVNLASAVQNSTVTLNWSPGAGTEGPLVYVIEVGSQSGGSDLGSSVVATPGIVANGVPNGLYFVRVRTANAGGVSDPSNEISVRVGCVGPPLAPYGLMGQIAGSAVAIGWQVTSGATGYVLEVGSASGATDLAVVPMVAPAFGSPGLAAPVPPIGVYYLRVRAINACGSSGPSTEFALGVGVAPPTPPPPPPPSEPVPPPPPPPEEPPPPPPEEPPPPVSGQIFGAVDPSILGTCSAATHDQWIVDGGDGFKYRTWHPQTDPSGCIFAHEHGDNPASMENAEIAAVPARFGYIGRRHPMPDEPNGHDEPHEGFKVIVANRGDVSDEGRVNRVYSRSVFHMGSGGPKRFAMQMHSAEIRIIHPEFGLKAFTQLMMDTGGSANVCDPRASTPTKDVVQLNSPCKLSSAYEIWSTTQSVRIGGLTVYTSFATPAVFDPITVRNPSNPSELVYAWDPRMAASKTHNGDWSYFRGCDRESYAQPGYWQNHRGQPIYWTDPMGNQLAENHPYALKQEISVSQSVGAPATTDGMHQFKMRRRYCQQSSRLGLKN